MIQTKSKWLFILLWVVVQGCVEQKEGCLDSNAINFDVSADKDCCCEYPKLKLHFSYQLNDSTYWSPGKTLVDVNSQAYKVTSFKMFVAHFEVASGAGEWYDPVGFSDRLLVNDKLESVSDNALVITNSKQDYELSKFTMTGLLSEIHFAIGLGSLQNNVNPALIESGPLSLFPDSLWAGPGQYIFQQWVIQTDTASAQLDTFNVLESPDVISLVYEPQVLLAKGKDYSVNVNMNLSKWLNGIDWQAGKLEIVQKIKENSLESISLVQ